MSRSPRKLATEDQLYAAALRALMRRAHSVYEMRQALERKAEDKSLVPAVLARLKEKGYLDDARYARQFAHYHAELRRQGRFRIARDLRARGVPDRHIEAALDEVSSEVDEAVQVRQRIARKIKLLRLSRSRESGTRGGTGESQFRAQSSGLDDRKLASLYRSLLRAGFTSDVIRRELRALTKRDVEADVGAES